MVLGRYAWIHNMRRSMGFLHIEDINDVELQLVLEKIHFDTPPNDR